MARSKKRRRAQCCSALRKACRTVYKRYRKKSQKYYRKRSRPRSSPYYRGGPGGRNNPYYNEYIQPPFSPKYDVTDWHAGWLDDAGNIKATYYDQPGAKEYQTSFAAWQAAPGNAGQFGPLDAPYL